MLYTITAHPAPGWIDSGELATVAHTLGVPHPTGSPLYVLLARLATVTIPGAFLSLTLLSVLCATVTLILFLKLDPLRGKLSGYSSAAAGALVLAAAPTFWTQATINEVYALQALLFAVFLFVWLKPRVRNRLLLLAYLAGLAFANHQSAIFLAPFLVERLWYRRRSGVTWLVAAACGLLAITLYLYLPVRSAQAPLLDWGGTNRWSAFWRHITGWQYSGWVGARSWDELAGGLGAFGAWLWHNFYYAALPVAVLGLIALLRQRRREGVVTLVAFLLCLAFGLNFPNPDVEAFYLLAFMLCALWVTAGVQWAQARARGYGAFAWAAVGLSVLASIFVHYEVQNRHSFRVPTDWVLDAHETVEPGSVILTREWDHYSPWLFLRFVEQVRPDVTWIDTELLRRSWYPEFIRRADPERYERAAPALERLAPQIALFEAGEPYDPAAIETAYADAIYALTLGQPGPVYVDGVSRGPQLYGVERRYLRGAREVPWGLLTRVFRSEERIPPLPPWPDYRNGPAKAESPRTQLHLDLYRMAREARARLQTR